jgi:hypothetical protein
MMACAWSRLGGFWEESLLWCAMSIDPPGESRGGFTRTSSAWRTVSGFFSFSRLPGAVSSSSAVASSSIDEMTMRRAFISYTGDEGATAKLLKAHLKRDCLGLMDVFVSSDEREHFPRRRLA